MTPSRIVDLRTDTSSLPTDEMREAMDRLDLYQQLQPSAFHRRHLNAQLRTRTWTGEHE